MGRESGRVGSISWWVGSVKSVQLYTMATFNATAKITATNAFFLCTLLEYYCPTSVYWRSSV